MRLAVVCVVACVTLWPAAGRSREVTLLAPREVRKGVGTMPRIVGPADAAEQRINAALARLDRSGVSAAAACRLTNGRAGSWDRTVTATMRGPDYLSYTISDSIYCGGAHPSFDEMSIVYDLHTGLPVDWTKLLPPALTGTVALSTGMDGTRVISLSSKRLFALFLAGYSHKEADCREAIGANDPESAPAMMVWLDAKEHGLGLTFGLPHVALACGEDVVVPVKTLQANGVGAPLLEAINAARR